MGWLFYNSNHYKPNGDVDRKKEMDSNTDEKYTVLKSTMIGTTYYAAIKYNLSEEVFGYVALTSSDKKRGNNFGYKGMDETCGPNESKCPISIINLLTPTDSEWANSWRDRCREYHFQKKSPTAFANLPIGTKIIWTIPHEHFSRGKKGERIELEKYKGAKQRACWVNWDERYRVNPKYVNMKDVEII